MTDSPVATSLPGVRPLPELSPADRAAILHTAIRLLGCEHLALDAFQEVLLALHQRPEPPEQPARWLMRAIELRARHLRRTVRRRQRHEHIASERCRWHSDCDNPLHVAIAHEVCDTVAAVRAQLPMQQREALDLFERSGLDYREIARSLDLPIGTVRSRLARARRQIRASVEHHASNCCEPRRQEPAVAAPDPARRERAGA
ncbi:MAG: sigma-70 family RNA polymerase sigma factor [bacterium]|nr:sigma-70 family RNA polymerase sigma factor [bacterium]